MKKITLFFVAIPLILTSCSKEPFADFTVSDTVVGVNETVYFTNHSFDAESYEWDFGDGFVSNSFNASHYFDTDGVYTVSLKAFNSGRVSTSYRTINVIGASLEITVEEYVSYLRVEDISVILYATLHDWENPGTSQMVQEKFTNVNGVVRFDNLAAQRYYVDVWGPNHDNYELAAEDVIHIETPILRPGEITYFLALVDYYPPVEKKSSLDRFQTKAKRMLEAEGKVPRSAADRK